MENYLIETLDNLNKITLNSKDLFFKKYDKIVDLIQKGFSFTNLNAEQFSIYPIGEYDYETNIENVAPFKIILEYTCLKEDIEKKINYLKMQEKKKNSVKNKILLNSVDDKIKNVLIKSEIAEIIETMIKEQAPSYSVTVKQNSILVRIEEDDNIFDFIIIIAYKYDKSSNDIYFKYKQNNIILDYDNYFDKMQDKIVDTNGRYKDAILLFKFFEFTLLINEKIIYKTINEFNLYENLFYNVPNELYVESIFDTLIYSVNYLSNTDINKFTTIDGKKLINDKLDYNNYSQYIKFIVQTFNSFINQEN